MLTTRRSPVPTIALGTPQVGQRAYSRLLSGFRTHFLKFTIRTTITLAGGPKTSLRNAGSAWSLVDFIGVEDNGDDIARISGVELRMLSQMVAPQHLTARRITSYADGVYVLEETAILPFAWPLSVAPVETCLVERNPSNALQAFVIWNDNGLNLVGGAGTAAVSNTTVSIEQVYDFEKTPPLFIPRYRSIFEPITATVTDFPIYIKTGKLLRGMIVNTYAGTVGLVADIISNIKLLSDQRTYIGPAKAAWADVTRWQEYQFGGNLHALSLDTSAAATQPDADSFLALNFQESGRLSNVINPANEQNFRIEVDAAVTAAAGAGSSAVRLMLMELEQVSGITAPQLPFQV